MRGFLMMMTGVALMLPMAAVAQNNTNVEGNGSLQILPNDDSAIDAKTRRLIDKAYDRRNVYIYTEDGLIYEGNGDRFVYGRNLGNNADGTVQPVLPYNSNAAPLSAVTDACKDADSVRERNDCIGDVIKEQKKLRRKYD